MLIEDFVRALAKRTRFGMSGMTNPEVLKQNKVCNLLVYKAHNWIDWRAQQLWSGEGSVFWSMKGAQTLLVRKFYPGPKPQKIISLSLGFHTANVHPSNAYKHGLTVPTDMYPKYSQARSTVYP